MNRSLLQDLTREEIDTFQNDGIVCLRNMFDADWMKALQDSADTIPGGWGDRAYMWTFNDTFREFAFDSPVGEVAATLMNSHTCGLYTDILFVKDPHSDYLTPWHHDAPYYQMKGNQTCGMWIGLDETTLKNGGLEWIRGSHKWGRIFDPATFDYKTYPNYAYPEVAPGRERIPDIGNHREDYDIVHFDTDPGDCIVVHSLILHSAGPNPTGSPRRGLTYGFYGDDARYTSIPPTRGCEDSRDLGMREGDPFPPNHELVPQIWPKRARATWPSPERWDDLPGSVSALDDKLIGMTSKGAALSK
jgi:ectoine hydroxylase-related dioxygenase (phytanoyl-CoA dioxygenase family)